MTTKLNKFKVQAVAQLLDTTVDTVRRNADEFKISIARQEDGPKTRIFTIENIFELAHARSIRDTKTRELITRKVIATIYAPKGGVGKTTLAANLACLFNLMGIRTLVVDLDFQSNLTLMYGYDSEITMEEAQAKGMDRKQIIEYHFGYLMRNWPYGRESLKDVIKKPFGDYGPHLVPADLNLDHLDTQLTAELINGQNAGDLAISKLMAEGLSGTNPDFSFDNYDLILFDAAPAKNRMTRGALLASDYVITPISMERLSTKALSYLSNVLQQMRDESRRSPEPLIVGNFFQQKAVRVMIEARDVANHYKDFMIDQTVRRSEEFPKAISIKDGLPLTLQKPSSVAAEELRAVAKELLVRMNLRAAS